MSPSGEVSAMVTARALLDRYARFPVEEKLRFFSFLEQHYNADLDEVRAAYQRYDESPDSINLGRLSRAAESRRHTLIRSLNQTPGATFDLINMRNDLLGLLPEHPQLQALDYEFRKAFKSWFGRSFLELRAIDWSTPAIILERIIKYEAVHEIQDWDDLKRRIDPDNRHCFAFFHAALDAEPLIFVQVALGREIPTSIGAILQSEETEIDVEDCDTATFYSISNCQPGLRNVSFGNLLIKQVARELQAMNPSIKRFVTLSPMPGLCQWLESERAEGSELIAGLMEQLEQDDENGEGGSRRERALKKLAAMYLLTARTGKYPWDAVARFHLGNGATIHQLQVDADLSPRGMRQSLGVMVNYLYDQRHIEHNHEQYLVEGHIHCDSAVQKQLG